MAALAALMLDKLCIVSVNKILSLIFCEFSDEKLSRVTFPKFPMETSRVLSSIKEVSISSLETEAKDRRSKTSPSSRLKSVIVVLKLFEDFEDKTNISASDPPESTSFCPINSITSLPDPA